MAKEQKVADAAEFKSRREMNRARLRKQMKSQLKMFGIDQYVLI